MIWLSWRQLRGAAVAAGVALGAVAAYLVVLGYQIRHSEYVECATDCARLATEFQERYSSTLYFVDAGLLVLPAVVGMFWGAPLVARELEAGTQRLVWNQSVTRRRWLAVKLLVVGVASAAVTGAYSALLTWAASPYDEVAGDRFTALIFGVRNIVPIGYAGFAFVLGVTLGLLLRRTLPAMALTVLVVVAVQIAAPIFVRPHLMRPVTADQPMTAEVVRGLRFLGADADVSGLRVPDAFVVSTSKMLGADGRVVDLDRYEDCVLRSPDGAPECIAKLNLHVRAEYHPADRYWTFQLLECAGYLLLAALLASLGLWRIRRLN